MMMMMDYDEHRWIERCSVSWEIDENCNKTRQMIDQLVHTRRHPGFTSNLRCISGCRGYRCRCKCMRNIP